MDINFTPVYTKVEFFCGVSVYDLNLFMFSYEWQKVLWFLSMVRVSENEGFQELQFFEPFLKSDVLSKRNIDYLIKTHKIWWYMNLFIGSTAYYNKECIVVPTQYDMIALIRKHG